MVSKAFALIKAFLMCTIGISALKIAGIPIVSLFFSTGNALALQPAADVSPNPLTVNIRNPFIPAHYHFGKTETGADTVAAANWVLRGTILSGDSGWVILENKQTGEQKWVARGEAVEGVRVKQVQRKRAGLENVSGVNQWALSLEQERKPSSPRPEMTFASTEVTEDKEKTLMVEAHEFFIKRSRLHKLIQKIPSFLNSLELILFEMESAPQGFLVSVGPQMMQLAPVGLEDGDLIRKINGVPVTSKETLIGVFDRFANEKDIVIEVDRENQIMEFTFHVQP